MEPANKSVLRVELGDTLQLQYVDEPDRDRKYVKLIGCLPGQSLMVTTPSQEGKLLLVREDQLFIVRMFSDTVNTVQGFTARVLKAHQRPYPYFHLSYPANCESQVIRKAHRVDLNLIISITNTHPDRTEEKTPARMTNLSTAGAQISSRKTIGEAEDVLMIFLKLLVCGVEKYLNLGGVIKRIRNGEAGEMIYGLEFLPMEEQETILLHSFVYENLVKNQ